MTEKEAFNNPEMKTIILLSRYVRELKEGADYETTTYQLAETLVKVFACIVSNQKQLIIDFLKGRRGEQLTSETITEIDNFLDEK